MLFLQDDDFTNAEAVLLTFSLNNFARNDSKFKVAMQWEKEFLKIVQEYQKNPSTNFTFAYMAEVMCQLFLTCCHKSFTEHVKMSTPFSVPLFYFLILFLSLVSRSVNRDPWRMRLIAQQWRISPYL